MNPTRRNALLVMAVTLILLVIGIDHWFARLVVIVAGTIATAILFMSIGEEQ